MVMPSKSLCNVKELFLSTRDVRDERSQRS